MNDHLKSQIIKDLDLIISALKRPLDKFDIYSLVLTVFLPALFLACVIFQPWVNPKWLFLDPVTAAEFSDDCCHSYFGFVSTAGIILWSSTASICLFTAAVLFFNQILDWRFAFMASAGLLSGWLALDDAFLMHEAVLPKLGIDQGIVLAIYVLLAAAYILFHWRHILRFNFWILGMGLITLALSLFVDTYYQSLEGKWVVLEDSAKFFGLFCWTSFHIITASLIMMKTMNSK